MIRARGLGRTYGRDAVLTGVDLDVRPGEVMGLIGPNGGGKSTLLLLIAGLVRPTSGEVVVCGEAADQLATRRTGQVGLITAEAGLYPLLSGRENLRFFGGLFGLAEDEVDARAAPLLDELDIGEHVDRPAKTYSSGMRQKVSLARALLRDPSVLLLDEPTSNLDPISSHTIHRVVRAQADRGSAVVLATHDLHAAESVCDRVAVIQRGVRHVEALGGARCAPPPGRLHQLYETWVHG